MEANHSDLSRHSSSSSAVDLSGTPAGLGSSRPATPLSSDSISRRRTSWGGANAIQDPLRFNLQPSDRDITPGPSRSGNATWSSTEDPFFSPTDEDPPFRDYSYRAGEMRYQDSNPVYSASQPGQSSASLISSHFRESGDTTDSMRDDDEAHLTSNMSRQGMGPEWGTGESIDAERTGASVRGKRRTVRYGASPLKKTGTTLKNFSGNLRRASLRVVNFGGLGLDEHVRLHDAHERDENRDEDDDEIPDEDEALPDLTKTLPIRGRTLGCLGPHSKLRLALYKFLTYP
ncbi:hypothetical protein TRAPUB_1917 [Trametes pubescens]|uniref:Uncharacterized protein n=1 Tax=Trametes pubescens TaxID=154538 RepID=A0A1M2VI28_TRAPU|nr:hypothetical protein TRAPUB_1917 [Trametes pubescens]